MARIKFSLLAGASASQRRVLLAVGRGATEAVVRGKGTGDGGLLGARQGALQLAPETRPRSPRPRRLPCLCATLMRCQAEDDAVVRRMRRRKIGATTARRRGYVVQHAELLWQPSISCACGRGRERDVFVCKGALYELLQTNALLRC